MNWDEQERIELESDRSHHLSTIEQLFAVDVRSLAALRIAMASMVLVDLARRVRDIPILYSDQGVLDANLTRQYLGSGFWSAYWIDGSPVFSQMLFLLTAVAAFGLLVGYKTRWMNVICLVLVWSLQTCNPLVLTGGHILLRMMLFWMVFLPTARVWSIDARWEAAPPRGRGSVLTVASAAILLQLSFMYFFAGLAKWNEYWLSGTAVQYALHLEMSIKPLGHQLAQFPEWLQLITVVVLFAEIIGPVLMFLPRVSSFSRGALMALFWLMHLGIWATFSIGIFSAVAMLSWLVFIPEGIWGQRFLGGPASTTSDHPTGRSGWSGLANALGAGFLVLVIAQHVSQLPFAVGDRHAGTGQARPIASNWRSQLDRISRATMTVQEFKMFGVPPLYSPWFSYAATLENGKQVDLFTGSDQRVGQRPESIYRSMQTQYWRRLHWNLITDPDNEPDNIGVYRKIRQRLLRIMIERWNQMHPDNRVQSAVLECHLDSIDLTGPSAKPGPAIEWARFN